MKIPKMRWVVAALLFLATMINYADRLALSVVSSDLRAEFGMTEQRCIDGDIEIAGRHFQRRFAAIDEQHFQPQPRAMLLEMAGQRGQEHRLGDIAGIDAKYTVGGRRIELIARLQTTFELTQCCAHRLDQILRHWRWPHAFGRPHK